MKTTIKNNNLTAIINHKGAELVSLKNRHKEYIWEGDPAFWGKHSPVLFPIVGTLKNNNYCYKNQTYSLSRHGFARDMEFDLIEKTANSVTFSIKSSDETLKVYPFLFELQIEYTLKENNLEILYKVINKGNEELLFSIGAHPALALPENFENYSLAFNKNEELDYYLLENDLLTNKTEKLILRDKKLDLNYQLFENDALIFKQINSKSITILENAKPLLKVNFEDFPDLGIWTKINAPFICIEPWFGYADTFNSNGNLSEKEGIKKLDPISTFKSIFSIEIL